MNTLSRREFLRGSMAAGVLVGGLAVPCPESFGAEAGAATKPGRIRIGQIGTGHAHAGGKMDTMRKSDDFEVVGIVEAEPGRRAVAESVKTYAGLKWMSEEELLGTPGLQAVAVETEVRDLVPTALRCIAAGKHIHLDKPAGESFRAFKQLLDEATRRKLTVQMGYMLRYNAALQLCHRLLGDGVLGDVFSIDAVMSKALAGAGRKSLLPYRGGSMFELGCHVIDAVVWMMGRPSKVTAYTRSSPTPDGFADNQLAVLEYPKAAVAVRSTLLEVEGNSRRQFVVCGTRGTFDIRPLEPPEARLALDASHGEYRKGYQDLKFPKQAGRYDGDFADLAKIIRGEKASSFPPEHDLAVHETVLLASGMPID
jgi:predicted dehydrogenase